MRETAVFVAIVISLLLAILRRVVYTCGGLDLPDFPALRGAYQDRFYAAQWDMPLWLCVFEVVLHALRANGLAAVRGARLGAVFAALRLGFTRYVCAREGDDCPSEAFGELMCSGQPCYQAQQRFYTWAAPKSMCAVPPGYSLDNTAVPLADMPDLVACRVAGCSSAATPLSTFAVTWQIGASALAGVLLLGINSNAVAGADDARSKRAS